MILRTLVFLAVVASMQAQEMPPGFDSVMTLGTRMAKLELASAVSSDFFRNSLDARKDNVGGHVVFEDSMRVFSVFYDKHDSSLIYHTYSFDKSIDFGSMRLDTHQRKATAREQDLIDLRLAAIRSVIADTTNFFLAYKFTALHYVVLADSAVRRVYIRTVSTREQFTLFGNDYKMIFDRTNNLLHREKLHQSLMPIEASPKNAGSRPDTVITHHSHSILSSDLPTETDVAALIIAAGTVPWKRHAVMTPAWNCLWDSDEKKFLFYRKEQK